MKIKLPPEWKLRWRPQRRQRLRRRRQRPP